MTSPDPVTALTVLAERQIALAGRLEPYLHAFACLEPEWLRERAWHLARQTWSPGPLAGLSLAVKDLLDVQGLPTGGGSRRSHRDDPAVDAMAVARLTQAGMLVLGKAHTVELAFGTWGVNRATATPRNPWDPEKVRVPGGSSSGSAVAVAAGLCDGAIGTDTGGSIRIPAALNNVTGIKPTYGRVSRSGCLPLSASLDTVGPLAGDIATAAHMLEAMAGADPTDPATERAPTGPKPGPYSAVAALARPLRGMRLGVLADRLLDGVEAAVGAAYFAACAVLERGGARLVEVDPVLDLARLIEPSGLLMAGEAWRQWRDRLDRYEAEMDPGTASRLRMGEMVSAAELEALCQNRRRDQQRFHAWLEDYDALLTPTVPLAAPLLAAVDEGQLPFSRFVRAASWLDLPAVAVPDGADAVGLPLSLQIMALPWREAVAVGIAARYQEATDWHRRRPDLEALIRAAASASPD